MHTVEEPGGGAWSDLEVCILGPARIVAGDQVFAAGGSQVAAAAAFLLLADGARVSRDQLAEALWGEDLPATWRVALRNALSRIRAWLATAGLDGSSVLRASEGGWVLTLPAAARVDLIEARRAVIGAEAALSQGGTSRAGLMAGEAARALAQTVAADIDTAWASQARSEVLQWRVRALSVAADSCLSRGDWPGAIAAASVAIEIDPYREASHRRVIFAHHASGNQAEALRAYERCRRMLADDLGLRPAIETQALQLRALGVDDAVALTSTSSRTGARPIPASALPEVGPTIGRSDELLHFARVDRVARFGRRQVVVVRGPAGIGKTQVAARFAELQLAAGRIVLFGRAVRSTSAYGVFADAFDRYLGSVDLASTRELFGWAAPALSDIVTMMAPEGGPDAGRTRGGAGGGRDRYWEAFAEVFRRLGTLGPVLFVVDDLDHCDDSSVALLHYLTERDLPGLLVLGTIRTGEPVPDGVQDFLDLVAGTGGLHELSLDPLTPEAIADLAGAWLGIAHPDLGLVDLLVAQTDGNPLLATQLLDFLAESGALGPGGGAVDVAMFGALGLPQGVTNLVRRRLGRLPPGAVRVARLAAVYGNNLTLETLGALGVESAEDLVDTVELLCAADLLKVDDDRPGHVRFRHALIAAAVRDSLGVTRRALLHRQVGLHLLAAAEKGAPVAAEAFDHLCEGGELVAPDARCRAGLAAGRQALAVSAVAPALRCLRAALKDLSAVALPVQADVWCTLGDAHRVGFERGSAREAYGRGLALARALNDPRLLVRAVDGLACGGGSGEPISADLAEREALLREGLAVIGDDDSVERTRLLANYGLVRYGCPDGEEADRQAVAIALRTRSPAAFAAALPSERLIDAGPMAAPRRRSYLDQLVALQGPRPAVELAVQISQAELHDAIELGDRDATDRALAAFEDQVERVDQPFHRWWVTTWRAVAAVIDGDLRRAEALAEEAFKQAIAPADDLAQMTYGISLLGLRLLQGREAEVIGLLTEAVGTEWDLPALRATLACAQARAGDLATARESYRPFANGRFASVTTGTEWGAGLYCLAQTAQLLGLREEADVLAESLAPHRKAMIVLSGIGASGGLFLGSISHLLGDLAALAGRWDDACDHFETALADHRSYRAPIFVALSSHSLAVALRRAGRDPTRAARLSAEARHGTARFGVVARDPGTGLAAGNR